MEFKVARSDFLKELTLIQGIVERRTSNPILANFLVQAEQDELQFVSTDLDLTLKHSCPADVKEKGSAALPTRTVFDVIRNLPEDAVTVQSGTESGRIMLQCRSSSYKIACLPAEEFPEIKDVKKFPVTVKASIISKVLNHVVFSICTEESRFPVTGALFILNPDSMEFVSTDGHRLSKVDVAEKPSGIKETLRTVVPRKALVEMKRIIDLEECDKISFAVDENLAFFKLGTRKLVSRLLEAEFPKYEKVIPKSNDKIFIFQRDEIAQTLRRVAAISSDRTQGIRLDVTPGKITVSSTLPETGEARDELATDYEGEPFEIGFNIQYLMDFFSHCEEDRIVLELKDQSAAGLLHPEDKEGYRFRYILMPMKI